jgi:hypothetical protein
MYKVKRLGLASVIFLALFLMVSLPGAQCADATGNAPVLVASQQTTIPLTANAVTGAPDTECPYKLTLKMGALFLHRSGNSKNYTEFNAPKIGSHQAVVKARDLDLEWATGTDDSLMLRNECYGVELRYFGAFAWSESADDYNSGGRVVDAYAAGKNKSWLNNGELNFHWWPCANDRYSLLMGVRFLRLKDKLTGEEYRLYVDEINQDDHYSISAVNQLWGGQLGVEGLLFGKREQGFSLDGVAKVGCFHNGFYMRGSRTRKGDVFYGTDSFSDSKTKAAFVGELGVNANYAFTKNISLSVGYEFLALTNMFVLNQFEHNRSLLYNGIHAGLNFAF